MSVGWIEIWLAASMLTASAAQTETIFERGAYTTEVVLADNWQTARMVARYSASAERRTVARDP